MNNVVEVTVTVRADGTAASLTLSSTPDLVRASSGDLVVAAQVLIEEAANHVCGLVPGLYPGQDG